MEILGIAQFNGQPTVTNPLSSTNLLVGRQTSAEQNNETASTTLVQEQAHTSFQSLAVVNQADQSESTGFDIENPGGTIDITV